MDIVKCSLIIGTFYILPKKRLQFYLAQIGIYNKSII